MSIEWHVSTMHNYYFSKTQTLIIGDMIHVKKANVKLIYLEFAYFNFI
jgi:hypothetical protein